jgi:hypothetical protein
MLKTKIAGAAAALALLATPSLAAAHAGHPHKGHHHKRHAREVTGTATATVASFANGELTLTLPSGKTFAAAVGPKTVLRCVTAAPQTPPAPATAARHGHDANDDDPGQGDVNGNGRCDATALVAGAKVASANLSLLNGNATWKKVVILT